MTALRKATLATKGEFDAPSVVKEVMPTFPELEYEALMRLESALLYRLKKQGVVEIVKEGAGRNPHTYRLATATEASEEGEEGGAE